MSIEIGRGGWIRTNAWQDQNLPPYRLATPLYRISLLMLVALQTLKPNKALMAGAAGFEPTHGRIKNRCLTALRRPYLVKLTTLHLLPVQLLKRSVQHRDVTPLCNKTWQSGWKLAGDFISIDLIWEAPKYTSSSAS